MKRYLLFCQLALLPILQAQAQVIFSSGTSANSFFIKSGTDTYFNGLTLRPSSDLNFTSKSLQISTTPVPLTPASISRVYVFNSAFDFSGRVGLFYQNGVLNGNNESTLQVAYGSNTSYTVTTGSSVNTTSQYVFTDIGSPVSFRTVTAATEGALPVTLLNFIASKEGKTARLYWQTTSETNSDYFEVQRSIDAKTWITLKAVPSWNESTVIRNYFYDDALPASGMNYYRLKMVDRNKQFAYSKMESLRFEGSIEVSLYPNPVVEKLKINIADWTKVNGVKLLNTQGQTFFESDNLLLAREVDMKNFPSGIYLVQVTYTNGSVTSSKAIKP